jgi:SAM-dependent methyltransferase
MANGVTGRRWYQNIEIEGQTITYESAERSRSKFWNEGKWENFIQPLLPRQRQTFLELGCNAGLFLKLAEDIGFKRITGVEARPPIMDQAECFKEQNGGSYKLLRQRVGADFDLAALPLSDVVLMANMHYYLSVPILSQLVDDLKNRCLYCIVVSAKARRRAGKAFHNMYSVRGYFRDWQEMEVIENVDMAGDPAPRKEMFGLLFKGNLDAWSVDALMRHWQAGVLNAREHKRYALPPALIEFFEKVLSGADFDFKETLLFDYWTQRRPQVAPEWILRQLTYKKKLAEDIRANGMKTPIFYDRSRKLLDGIHRLVIANLLGYEHVLVRRL